MDEIIVDETIGNWSLFIAIPEGTFGILHVHIILSASRGGCLRLEVGLETIALSGVVTLQILLLEHWLLRGLLLLLWHELGLQF